MMSWALPANGTKNACPVTPSTSSARQAADIEALSRLCRFASKSLGLRSTDTMIERISLSTGMEPDSACSKRGASGRKVFSKIASSLAIGGRLNRLKMKIDASTRIHVHHSIVSAFQFFIEEELNALTKLRRLWLGDASGQHALGRR